MPNKPLVVTIPRDKLIANTTSNYGRGCALGWVGKEMTGKLAHPNIVHAGEVGYLHVGTFSIPWTSRVATVNNVGMAGEHGVRYDNGPVPKTREEMEFMLRELFAEQGMTLRFVGEYADQQKTEPMQEELAAITV